MLFRVALVGALTALTAVTRVTGHASCVQLNATELSSCPCDDSSLTFTVEGQTTVAANTVNLAIIVDGSGSINDDEFLEEKNFTKAIVTAFAARNLFANGGNASYVQYASDLETSASFNSADAFNDFVDSDPQARGGTNTASGIDEGRELLGATINASSASFMIVITDGGSNTGASPESSADAARAEGIIVLAVGVGNGVNYAELVGIGGNASNVFSVSDFNELDAALSDVISSSGGSTILCPSTGATLTVEFNVSVAAVDSGAIDGSTVTFYAADLENNPTDFEALLDVCSSAIGEGIVVSANYTDDQGNHPDLSALTGLGVGNDYCTTFTPSPSSMYTGTPTLTPTATPTEANTGGPSMSPTYAPTMYYTSWS